MVRVVSQEQHPFLSERLHERRHRRQVGAGSAHVVHPHVVDQNENDVRGSPLFCIRLLALLDTNTITTTIATAGTTAALLHTIIIATVAASSFLDFVSCLLYTSPSPRD